MKLNEIFDAINYFKLTAPVDVEGLALALQLKVERQNLSDEICGMIKRKDGKYIIVVNQNHVITRQRFTIAHEIGHFIYHRPKIGDGVVDNALYRQVSYNGITNNEINAKDEQQANNFAANLLMPRHLIDNIRNQCGGSYDEIKLAEKLNVSVQAIKIRLDNLELHSATN
jgi:Zn-dependent peptidase ImmA (M78 family)